MVANPAISRESRCDMIPAMMAEAKAAEPMMFSSTMSICASMTPEAERMLHRQESVLGRWATSADGTFSGGGVSRGYGRRFHRNTPAETSSG